MRFDLPAFVIGLALTALFIAVASVVGLPLVAVGNTLFIGVWVSLILAFFFIVGMSELTDLSGLRNLSAGVAVHYSATVMALFLGWPDMAGPVMQTIFLVGYVVIFGLLVMALSSGRSPSDGQSYKPPNFRKRA